MRKDSSSAWAAVMALAPAAFSRLRWAAGLAFFLMHTRTPEKNIMRKLRMIAAITTGGILLQLKFFTYEEHG